ncbi:hypothetical protein CYY_001105 [Polysphondylium violaceum]|uniref:HEAT repeat-containing protein 1 n=1 Tax=Polysphondylium violaceum TaxID=133409 RepID=A0A8J4VAV9_9MYCE|nr:hypothetical protein CYY_001105 [Polysphondylium violaceum]
MSKTSLDQQLGAIKEKLHYVDVSRRRDSLLFDEVQAANIEMDAVLAMGQEGIKELIKLDARFKPFLSTLYSEESKQFNRVLKTSEENAVVDGQIAKFLQLQSNYFLLNSSHKALEWLIRRYRINEFNIDDIMSSIIPYHESNIFAKFLSLLRFEFNKKWNFLEGVRKSKLYITRDYFSKVIKNHTFFVEFLCNTIITYEKTDTISKSLISFFTALLLEIISDNSNFLTSDFLRQILPSLNFSLKSKNLDLQLGSFMILGLIVSKIQLKQEVIELLFKNTLKNCSNSINPAFTFLMVLFQKQTFTKLSNETLSLLVSIPSLCEILLDFYSQNKSLDRILNILFTYLCNNYKESSECFTLLHQLITDLPTDSYHAFIFNIIIKGYIDQDEDEQEENKINESTTTITRLLSPSIVQEQLEQLISSTHTPEVLKLLNRFSSQVLQKKTLSKSKSNTIFLQLQSYLPNERKEGISMLKNQINAGEQDFDDLSTFSTSICLRLVDSDTEIAVSAWTIPHLHKIVQSNQLLLSAQKCLAPSTSKFDNEQKKAIIQVITDKEFISSNQGREEIIFAVVQLVLDQICNQEMAIALLPLVNDLHPIFKGLSSLKKVADVQSIAKHIASNIASQVEATLPLVEFILQSTQQDEDITLSNSQLFLISCISLTKDVATDMALPLWKLVFSYSTKVFINSSQEDDDEDQVIAIDIDSITNDAAVYQQILSNSKNSHINVLAYTICNAIEGFKSITSESIMEELKQYEKDGSSMLVDALNSLSIGIFESKIKNIDTILKRLIKKFFGNQLVLFKFLSGFWNINNTGNNNNSTLILSSLGICKYLVGSKTFTPSHSILVPFILLLLNKNDSSIRSTSLDCIQEISDKISTTTATATGITLYQNTYDIQLKDETFSTLLSTLLSYRNEFTLDSQFLYHFVEKVLFNNNDNKLTKEEITSLGTFLIHSALNIQHPATKLAFLSSIQGIAPEFSITIVKNYLVELLDKFKDQSITVTETKILDLLLKKLISHNVLSSAKLRKEGVFAIFLNTLSMSQELSFEDDSFKYCVLDVTLSGITKDLLTSIPVKEQVSLVETVLSHFLSESTTVRDIARVVLTSILVDATTIVPLLLPSSGATTAKQRQPATPSTTATTNEPIPRYNSLLEIIRINSSKITNVMTLLPPIFGIIKRLDSNHQDAVEYCKQLAMSALLSIAQIVTVNKSDASTAESLFDIGAIVKAVENSNNLQTTNNSLLLLSFLSTKYPQKIFKFFDSVLKMLKFILVNGNDNFSLMILSKFLKELLPSLVQHGISLTTIFKLVLDSFSSIPKNHRLSIFNSVVKSVDYQQLHLLFYLILIKKIQGLRDMTNKLKDQEDAMDTNEETELDQFNDFVSILCDQIPVVEMSASLASITKYLNFISIDSGLCVADEESATTNSSDAKGENEIIQLLAKSNSKDNRLLQVNTLDFICERLCSRAYLESLSFQLDQEQKDLVEKHYLVAFENLLVLLKKITESMEALGRSGTGKEKYMKKLLSTVHLCMDRYSQLLSVQGFISTITQLLNHSDANVRRRSLVIFNEKITLIKNDLSSEDVVQFLTLLDSFSKIIENNNETETNKQTALLSFEILARNFATSHPSKFLSQIPIIIKSMGHSSHQVVSSSLICIATLCSELQSKTIPYIPQFFPLLLNTLTGSYKNAANEETETRTLLQISCISSLEMMLNKISKFLSPYLPQLLNALLHPRLTSHTSQQLSTKLFAQVKKLLTLITKNVEFRLLLPAMFSAYEFAIHSENDQSLICLFDFVGDISSNLGPKDIALHHKSIFKFYLQCFEFRKKYKNRVKNVDKVEEHIINSFMTLVMKLNENLFKPLFIKILDWALNVNNNSNENVEQEESEEDHDNKKLKTVNGKKSPVVKSKDNIMFFYKIVNSLASNLKTIFVPYYGYFMDESIHQLLNIFSSTPLSISNQTVSVINGNNSNNKRKKNSNNSSNSNNVESMEDQDTLCLVISALEKCFMYDTDGFLDKQKFEQVLPALANQLENQMGSLESYKTRINNYLAPCITQLAVAINQDLLWKHLNHTILMKTRSPYSLVRHSSLVVIHSLHKRLGEQLLPLLPETMPFISELMEDSVPEVEQLCQDVVKTIESHLGVEESISHYL